MSDTDFADRKQRPETTPTAWVRKSLLGSNPPRTATDKLTLHGDGLFVILVAAFVIGLIL